jgi:hypothetical protein
MAKGVLSQVLIMYVYLWIARKQETNLVIVVKYLKHKQCKP